jgi:membrane protein DedA with SNARE-associated domain
MHWFIHIIRYALLRWGYWALAAGLIAEDAGLPLPGETALMFSSFLAHKSQDLRLYWVIVAGIGAAIVGDNLGYWAGRHFGPRLLGWLRKRFHMAEDIEVARNQIRRHGKATIFWARFIFGLRTIAGPVAGALEMPWPEFLLYNALGAATWVSAIACLGYGFGGAFNSLASYFEKASWAIAATVFVIGYLLWRRQKKRYRASHAAGHTAA